VIASGDRVRHVDDGRNSHAGITLKRDLLDAIALAAKRALGLEGEVPLRRHEVVNPQHRQDLAAQIVAPGEPRLACLGQRQWLELLFEEGRQHSLRLVSREQLLVQPAFPRPVFRQSGG